MPTYVYKFVDTGETIEIQQSFSDPTLTEAVHPTTGEVLAVKKVFQPVGVTFKGSGFYKTDSRGKSTTSPSSPSTDSASTGTTSTTSSDSSSTPTSSTSTTAPASTPAPAATTSAG